MKEERGRVVKEKQVVWMFSGDMKWESKRK
jgi:hypothetical protein